jgi:mannose-6-phosphate isomerase-like protein (cupin superfamily)
MLATEVATMADGDPVLDIQSLALANDDFRRELTTAEHSQVVLMTIPPGGEIGEEVHEGIDQLLVFLGEAEGVLEGRSFPVRETQLVVVPAGTRHNFKNTGDEPLRLWTVYAPPEHEPGTVHKTKAEADEAEEAHG